MIKAAYNDRGSDYGWNVDHIFPQSRSGKTTESNLIYCHILTNDEKADKFPCHTQKKYYFIYNKNLTKKQIPDNIEKVIEQSEMVAYNIGYGSNK